MFNFIVKGPWANSRDKIWASRVFEATSNELITRYKPQGSLDFVALAQLPTVFAEETRRGDEIARIGTIVRGRVVGTDVEVTYQLDPHLPGIPNSKLEKFAADFGIEQYEFSRNHWAIKDANLFLVLLRQGSLSRQRPSVFQLQAEETIQQDQVSAMMPFAPAFGVVSETFEAAARALNLQYHRADDIWQHDHVMQDIVALIDKSMIIVADCTGRNANVFYEVGIAHTLGRKVILVTQNDDDIPFDLRHLRYIKYLNNAEGRAGLQQELIDRMRDLLRAASR